MRITGLRALVALVIAACLGFSPVVSIAQETWDGASTLAYGAGQYTLERRVPWRGEELRTKLQGTPQIHFSFPERRVCGVRDGPDAVRWYIGRGLPRAQVVVQIAELKRYAGAPGSGGIPFAAAMAANISINTPLAGAPIPVPTSRNTAGDSVDSAALLAGQPSTTVVRYRCLVGAEISAYLLAAARALENYYGITPAGQ